MAKYYDEKDVKSPIYFIPEGDDWRINPIYDLDTAPNTPDRFVIVKTTGDGKYVVGNMIHYVYNGIDIMTDSDNAIFVDKINKTVMVREYGRALREINPENPEERQYVLLLVPSDNAQDGFEYQWEAITGRTPTYEWIKSMAGAYNPKKSLVLTENVALKDALSISQFVKHLKNADIIGDDDFYIEAYEEDEYED